MIESMLNLTMGPSWSGEHYQGPLSTLYNTGEMLIYADCAHLDHAICHRTARRRAQQQPPAFLGSSPTLAVGWPEAPAPYPTLMP